MLRRYHEVTRRKKIIDFVDLRACFVELREIKIHYVYLFINVSLAFIMSFCENQPVGLHVSESLFLKPPIL